jgi:hypothetical protein
VSELAAFSDAMEGKPYLKCTAAEAASAVDVCRKLAAHLMGNNMA